MPKKLHVSVDPVLRSARQLERLANSFSNSPPRAATSLRCALKETLTLIYPCIAEVLHTDSIENVNALIEHYTRNARLWRDRHMVPRWIGAALQGSSRGFRAVRGYRDMK